MYDKVNILAILIVDILTEFELNSEVVRSNDIKR